MKKLICLLLVLATTVVVTACGGGGGGGGGSGGGSGGGGSTPTGPNESFSLAEFNSTTVGTVYTTSLEGSDTNGVSYTGSISLANRAQIMLGGILVTPRDSLFNITGGGLSITTTSTGYTDSSGLFVGLVVQTTGLACAPVSPDKFPSSVKIGDFGVRSTLICNDNTTWEGNWRVEDAGNGEVDFVTSITKKDQFNTILQIADGAYRLDGAGQIVGFTSSSTLLASAVTVRLESI